MNALRDLARETLRSLRAHALRFGVTSLGIVWGIAMLTFLAAMMDGYDQNFARQINKIGQRVVFLFPGIVTKQHVGQRGARHIELEMDDLERMAKLHHVESAAAHLWVGPRMMRAGRRTKLVWTWGGSADTIGIRNFEIAAGRALTRRDVDTRAHVVFLGATTARRLFGTAHPVGRAIHIDGIPFRVIGLAAPKGEQLVHMGPADDEIAMIPVTTAQQWFTKSDTIGNPIFAPRTRETSWDAVTYVRSVLGLHHHFGARDDTAMDYFNIEEAVQIVRNLGIGLRIFLGTASLITLLVGAVGVMNIMLVVVSERTKEIGLRKAVGASNAAIFRQFAAETLTVTVAAGLVGMLLGGLCIAATAAIIGEGSRTNAPPVLQPEAALLILGTLAGVGLLSGVLPALRASRIDPATSLRGG